MVKERSKTGTPPVKENEELDLTIEGVGEKGDGIAKIAGYVIIVKGATTGEQVRARITKVKPSVAFAEKI